MTTILATIACILCFCLGWYRGLKYCDRKMCKQLDIAMEAIDQAHAHFKEATEWTQKLRAEQSQD